MNLRVRIDQFYIRQNVRKDVMVIRKCNFQARRVLRHVYQGSLLIIKRHFIYTGRSDTRRFSISAVKVVTTGDFYRYNGQRLTHFLKFLKILTKSYTSVIPKYYLIKIYLALCAPKILFSGCSFFLYL